MPPRQQELNATSLTDHDLVKLAQKGSDRAYRELLGRYQRPVFSLVYRMVRDREQAEDLAQETFVRVHQAIRRFDPDGPARLGTWILTIARRLCTDRARGARLRIEVHEETRPEAAAPGAVPIPATGPRSSSSS